MSEQQVLNECMMCGSELPAGATQCPACGEALLCCSSSGCGQSYPASAAFCPTCGEANPTKAASAPHASRMTEDQADAVPAPAPVPANPADAASQSPPIDAMNGLSPLTPLTPLTPMAGVAPAIDFGRGPAPKLPTLPGFAGAASADMQLPTAMRAPTPTIISPVAAMPLSAAPLSIPSLGFGNGNGEGLAPILAESDVGQRHRCGRQSLLRVRLRGETLPADVEVDVVIESRLLGAPTRHTLRLAPGDSDELPGVPLLPRVGGQDQVRLTLTARLESGLPLGRWVGGWMLNVEQEERAKPITAGGDVIIMGGNGPGVADMLGGANLLPGSGGGSTEVWQVLTLKPDRDFRRRLDATRPPPARIAPDAPAAYAAASMPPQHVALCVSDPRQPSAPPVVLLLASGTGSATMGRGGLAEVPWWVRPLPHDDVKHGRLSRRHASIELHDGRAWLQDLSTNGTLLNNNPASRGDERREILANGDVISPGGVLPMRVTLDSATADAGVATVTLWRQDGLAGRMAYVLTAAAPVVPLRTSPRATAATLWCAWVDTDQGTCLALTPADRVDWTLCTEDQPAYVGGVDVRWRRVDAPADHETFLVLRTR